MNGWRRYDWLLGLAVLALLAMMLGACGRQTASTSHPIPLTGLVTRTDYDDPDDWTTSHQDCYGSGKDRWCLWVTDSHHDDAHWFVLVADDMHDVIRRVEVTEATYNKCHRGASWDASQTCLT